jgi:hypothetical protein
MASPERTCAYCAPQSTSARSDSLHSRRTDTATLPRLSDCQHQTAGLRPGGRRWPGQRLRCATASLLGSLASGRRLRVSPLCSQARFARTPTALYRWPGSLLRRLPRYALPPLRCRGQMCFSLAASRPPPCMPLTGSTRGGTMPRRSTSPASLTPASDWGALGPPPHRVPPTPSLAPSTTPEPVAVGKPGGPLATFMRHASRTLTRAFFMKEVWQTDFLNNIRTLEAHVCTLHRKLAPSSTEGLARSRSPDPERSEGEGAAEGSAGPPRAQANDSAPAGY